MHRFLAGTAVAFTAMHIVGLVADNYVHFGMADVLVPFASSWRPGAVALGVIAMYLLVAIELSSLLMRRIPRRLWRGIHLSSYVAFWMASFHLVTAGTDAGHPLSKVAVVTAIGMVVFLTLVRALTLGERGHRHQPAPRTAPTSTGARVGAATGQTERTCRG
jgi:predicted ferric reductase